MREEVQSIRPRALVLVSALAAVAAMLATEVWRASRPLRAAPSEPSTGSSVLTPERPVPVEISGDVTGLAPGLTRAIAVTLGNPNAVPVYVTGLHVEIAPGSAPAGCAADVNLRLRQASEITVDAPVVVQPGARVTVTSPPRAPALTFLNLPDDQDACKDVRFELTFSAEAHS